MLAAFRWFGRVAAAQDAGQVHVPWGGAGSAGCAVEVSLWEWGCQWGAAACPHMHGHSNPVRVVLHILRHGKKMCHAPERGKDLAQLDRLSWVLLAARHARLAASECAFIQPLLFSMSTRSLQVVARLTSAGYRLLTAQGDRHTCWLGGGGRRVESWNGKARYKRKLFIPAMHRVRWRGSC